jgi:hypothetical protein
MMNDGVTRRGSWLRHCATSRKISGSILDVVTQVFHCLNPLNTELNLICHLLTLLGAHPILHVSSIRVNLSGRTTTLGSTQAPTQISTRDICWR